MLHWIYTAMAAWIAWLLLEELFEEKSWRIQVSLVLILIPLVLRILQIK